MNSNYAKAYVEVLEILKYLPEEEYEKIPKEKIQFYRDNCDQKYSFDFNISKPLDEQVFLKETNIIIVTLFRDYFATSKQKEKLQKILLINEEKYQDELRKKYNPDDIFKKEEKVEENKHEECVQLVEIKEENLLQTIFKKIINWIKGIV